MDLDPAAPPAARDHLSEQRGGHGSTAAATFSVMWAIAMLFHIASGPMRFQALPHPTALGVNLLAVALVALAVMLRPRDVRLLIVLAALQVPSVWLEAPMLGNHWLVAGFVNLALLAAAGSAWWSQRRLDTAEVFRRFAPVARWVLLVFYSFAAFAKLNTAFMDPVVSCATFFFRESLGVFGIDPLAAGERTLVGYGVVAASGLIELVVPVLLLVRRTRNLGVLLAVVFHTLIGFDLAHPFFDFSSLLLALFVLFLPADFPAWLRTQMRWRGSRRQDATRSPLVHIGLASLAALVLAALGPATPVMAVVVLASSYLLWFWYGAAVLIAVAIYVLRCRPAGQPVLLAVPSRTLLLVPVLVLFNGLTPYLELKTAYGFDMYSNLVTVDGRTNHLVVPSTLPLTDVHADLVEIRSSADPDLEWYADNGYALPWLALRAYLEDHPELTVEYLRGGVVQQFGPGDEVEAVPVWQEKLMAFRAVDLHSPKRCQDRWGVAN